MASASMLVKILAFTLTYYCAILQGYLSPAAAAGHETRHRHNSPVSREELRADYLRWVERVRDRVSKSATQAGAAEWVDAYHASEAVARVITVSQSGHANFKSVQAAVNSVPNGNTARVIIQVSAGVYYEKVKIPRKKRFITILGASGNQGRTVITWHDNARSAGSTLKSATFTVMADGFIAKYITFVNTAPSPRTGAKDMQAVAFQISGDKASIYNCKFIGKQDTLYDHKGRHYFRDCYIEGSVDFIFGYGLSLYEGCHMHAVARAYGSFTAQRRRSSNEESGFSFVRCTLTGGGAVLYLGRAWGTYSRVVFIACTINARVTPAGWSNWGDVTRQRTVFYGEYMCRGPGANARGRVLWAHQLTAAQAAPFMSLSFIDGQAWVSQ